MPDMTQPARRSSIWLWCALFAIGTSWGASQYFSKLIVIEDHHPLGISAASTGLGAVLVTLFALSRGITLPITRRHLVYYAICGLVGTALPNYTSYASMRELPLGIMSIIIAVVPMMTFIAAVALRIDRPEPRRVLGLVLGAVAMLILIVPGASLPRPGDAFWVAVALSTGVSYTVENLYIARARPDGCSALATLVGLNWMALLMILPVTAATGTWMSLGNGSVDAALVAMTLAHLLAYGGFVWLIGQSGPVFAAQVGYVVTLSGVAFGVLLLGERHAGGVWLSLALMLAGLALVQPRKD